MSTIQSSNYYYGHTNTRYRTNIKNDFTAISIDDSLKSAWIQATAGLSKKEQSELMANTLLSNDQTPLSADSLKEAISKFKTATTLSSGIEKAKFSKYTDVLTNFSNLINQLSYSKTNITP